MQQPRRCPVAPFSGADGTASGSRCLLSGDCPLFNPTRVGAHSSLRSREAPVFRGIALDQRSPPLVSQHKPDGASSSGQPVESLEASLCGDVPRMPLGTWADSSAHAC